MTYAYRYLPYHHAKYLLLHYSDLSIRMRPKNLGYRKEGSMCSKTKKAPSRTNATSVRSSKRHILFWPTDV